MAVKILHVITRNSLLKMMLLDRCASPSDFCIGFLLFSINFITAFWVEYARRTPKVTMRYKKTLPRTIVVSTVYIPKLQLSSILMSRNESEAQPRMHTRNLPRVPCSMVCRMRDVLTNCVVTRFK
jgi:hypothetical protein